MNPPARDVLNLNRNPIVELTVGIDDHDQMRGWTWIAIGGVAVAIVFAVIGGFPFDTPMPTHSFGWVEPTCGLTRGSTAIARGDFALAWHYNPAAFLVIGFGLAGLARAAVGALTSRWLRITIRPHRAGWVCLAGAFLVLWAHQQSNAEFIINSRA